MTRPNVVFVFADQWRHAATGFAGNPDVRTPELDRLAGASLNFSNAISGCPVCCPARASLLTGAYPHQHGVFVNDVPLGDSHVTLGEAFTAAGYATGYIGKWHLDGRGRSAFTPPERRKGFRHWQALECSHDYNRSAYYAGDDPTKRFWPGYDAEAQTATASNFIREHGGAADPFLLLLSWGPPHAPYDTAPERFRRMYDPAGIKVPPNVPAEFAAAARRDLCGYYAHCSALDEQVGRLLWALDDSKVASNTIFVFWSDHGDLLYAHGERKKQRPWEEAIRVPLLVRWPRGLGTEGRVIDGVINTPDLMPTLLDLAGVEIPSTVQGTSYAKYLRGEAPEPAEGAVLASYHPFGEYERRAGGREFRGWRTKTHTYLETLEGPWLLYDNVADPWQMTNLVSDPEQAAVCRQMRAALRRALVAQEDAFLPGEAYLQRWGYATDEHGTVPYNE